MSEEISRASNGNVMCMPNKVIAKKTAFNKVISTKILSNIDIPLTMFLHVSRYDEMPLM